MSTFEIAVWIYLGIGLVVFGFEFSKHRDPRKWLIVSIPLLFITFLWPGLLLVNALDRTRSRKTGKK